MSGILSPTPIFQGFAGNGQFLTGGQLFTYQAGTNIPVATYTDSTLSQANTNPVILNAYGQASVWLNPATAYKYVLQDSAGNILYTKDNINVPVVPTTYPQSQAEINAGVTPANLSYPYGAWRRYGADPLGNTDSGVAIAQASSCNNYIYDDYPGGGNYILANTVVLSHYPLTIQGQARNIGNGVGGTRITLQSGAGASASIFNTTSFYTGLTIDKIAFQWQNPALGQFGLRFQSDLTAFVISNCAFVNSSGGTAGVTAIQFQNAVQFSGAGSIRDNYFAAIFTGIDLGGVCTTIKIRDNEIYGNLSSSLYGVHLHNGCIGTSIIGNTFEGWSIGIQNDGAGIVQADNYFEGNTTADFDWSAAQGVNRSLGDQYIGSASPVAIFPPFNNTTGCTIFGGSFGNTLDSQFIAAWRGFNELGLAANMGYGTTAVPTISANGGGTVSAVVVSTFSFSRVGGMMFVQFDISMNLAGATTTGIQMAIPQGLTAVGTNANTCQVLNGGSTGVGLALTSGSLISISLIAGGNWTAGAIQVNGMLPIRIIS